MRLPDNPAPYLTDWLFEIGPSVPTGMGEAAIGYADMDAWQRLTGVELAPWEAKALRRLSRAFVGQRQEARKASCPAPYTGLIEEKRDKVAGQFAAMMKAVQARARAAKKGTTDGGSAGRQA